MNTQPTKESIIRLLKTNDKAVAKALVALNKRQTADERSTEATRYQNGRGFRPCHARMGTSMAKFYEERGYLTTKQANYWRVLDKTGTMRIAIYAGQLLEVAQEKAAKQTVGAPKAALVPTPAPRKQPKYAVFGLDTLLEEEMLVREMIASTIDPRELAELEDKLMNLLEAIADRQETARDEHNKFLAKG